MSVIALFASAMTPNKIESKQNESSLYALLMYYVHIGHFKAHDWYETNITLLHPLSLMGTFSNTIITNEIVNQNVLNSLLTNDPSN